VTPTKIVTLARIENTSRTKKLVRIVGITRVNTLPRNVDLVRMLARIVDIARKTRGQTPEDRPTFITKDFMATMSR
jgi:hypothetical protein